MIFKRRLTCGLMAVTAFSFLLVVIDLVNRLNDWLLAQGFYGRVWSWLAQGNSWLLLAGFLIFLVGFFAREWLGEDPFERD